MSKRTLESLIGVNGAICLLLFYLRMRVDACKSKDPGKDLQFYEDEPTESWIPPLGTTTKRTITEWTTTKRWPITEPPGLAPINTNRRNFLAYVTREDTKQWGTGVRVLPYVVVTSNFINDTDLTAFVRMKYINDEGSLVMLKPLTISITGPDDKRHGFVAIIGVRHEPLPQTRLNTIPIASRTMTLADTSCYVFATTEKLEKLQYSVDLITNEENCSRRTICVRPNFVKACFNPIGSVLVCNGRLAGVRKDTEECLYQYGYYRFFNVRYSDYWITWRTEGRYYSDYDIVGEGTIKQSMAPSLVMFDTTLTISVFLQLFFMYIN
ncbi:hypothetical protein Trydic_g14538 [Trypoxylus dichotomus]